MNETSSTLRITPALVGFVLAAAIVIALCSALVSQTDSDTTVNNQRVVQLGYGLPFTFTSATASDTNPLNIFTYSDQATNPKHWQPLSYLGDVLLWATLIGFIVWQAKVSVSVGSFVGLVVAAIIFLAMMNLIFTFA
jgi:hypothetical protein